MWLAQSLSSYNTRTENTNSDNTRTYKQRQHKNIQTKMSHISVSHYTVKRKITLKSSNVTAPFENTRYMLFTPVKLLEDGNMKYTNSLYCLKESEDSYNYFTKDVTVQRTLTLDDLITCFMHLFWELFDLSILPPVRYIYSGSFISVKTINNLYSYVYITIYCEFTFGTTFNQIRNFSEFITYKDMETNSVLMICGRCTHKYIASNPLGCPCRLDESSGDEGYDTA